MNISYVDTLNNVKRISLSIKALLGDEEEVEAEAESTEE